MPGQQNLLRPKLQSTEFVRAADDADGSVIISKCIPKVAAPPTCKRAQDCVAGNETVDE